MISKVFSRKTAPPDTSGPETSTTRVIRHPLSREEAQERGAKGNEAKRQRKVAEAMVMRAIREESPLLGVIADAFPQLREQMMWKNPELLEGLLKTVGTKAIPPGQNDDEDSVYQRLRHRAGL